MGNWVSSNVYPGPAEMELQACFNTIHRRERRVATYRCKYTGPIEWTPPVNGNQLSFPAGIPALRFYWVSSIHNESDFLACDDCISEEARRYFTYHPEGWMEDQNVARYSRQDYEPIKLSMPCATKIS
jgi:hypothetical protein